jgi:hypothetical protein
VNRQSVALALALLAWAGTAQAQTRRTFSTFRQLHGETRLGVRLEYAAGNLRVGPSSATDLYRMDLSYDDSRFLPVSDFDSHNGSVVLGLRPAGQGGVPVVSRDQLSQTAKVTLSPTANLALDMTLGAADADVELGGLRLSNFQLKTGASRTVIRFSHPNAVRCEHGMISAGAAEITVLGLGNSRCDDLEFEGGVGKVVLDFRGAWRSSSRMKVTMALGAVTLRLPRNLGVQLQMDKFLSSFEPAGLVRHGTIFQSPSYTRAAQHLDLDLTCAVGGVDVEWVD